MTISQVKKRLAQAMAMTGFVPSSSVQVRESEQGASAVQAFTDTPTMPLQFASVPSTFNAPNQTPYLRTLSPIATKKHTSTYLSHPVIPH